MKTDFFYFVLFLSISSEQALCFILDEIFHVHGCGHDSDCVSWCKSEPAHCYFFRCVCSDHHDNFHHDIKTTTPVQTTKAHFTTTPFKTTHETTTTQQPLVKLECSNQKISVIESIAENLHVEDSRAALCPGTTKHQTSEAFVMNKCNSKSRSSWTQGQTSLKTVCSTKQTIQPYTPISTFYKSEENVAGFFIACTDAADGIKVAVQNCSDPPKVMTITETTSPKMSDFFIIYERP
eukprot:XP_011445104.1 PREDICTED: uncharacterized protein LOC105340632 [Crassostrea gigas]